MFLVIIKSLKYYNNYLDTNYPEPIFFFISMFICHYFSIGILHLCSHYLSLLHSSSQCCGTLRAFPTSSGEFFFDNDCQGKWIFFPLIHVSHISPQVVW